MNIPSVVCLLISAVAAAFLVYSLFNLDALEIGILHPRVLVEFSIAVGFGLLGVILWA